ncbi:MAG TPA: KpsF/GutQ family sugar-phosphate isomerase [Gammaproteobacteria bacterium]|nr:KpsF/GutQ family sugar-phosphate isomerase [Gammaproteobacteria bacterium]
METLTHNFINIGRQVIEIEASALMVLKDRLNQDFTKSCQILYECKGRIVVTGMGKSGHIGKKIAATLASTGSPSFFVHPAEASHGDMGMITPQDVVLALSYSGQTKEILTLLPLIKRQGTPLVSMTGNKHSTLARFANVNIDIAIEKEACALGLAPTTSTTATLAMWDAIAIALLDARGFSKEDFAFSHPGGSLGKRLLLTIHDIMHQDNKIPIVNHQASLKEALVEMTRCRLGMTAIIDDKRKLIGIFTDGDLRRALDNNLNISKTPITEIMTTTPKTVLPGLLAAEALRIMELNKINGFFVVNEEHEVVGAFNMHDLLQSGVL